MGEKAARYAESEGVKRGGDERREGRIKLGYKRTREENQRVDLKMKRE